MRINLWPPTTSNISDAEKKSKTFIQTVNKIQTSDF